jgi:ParB/RepB/Spo0J family partition protein
MAALLTDNDSRRDIPLGLILPSKRNRPVYQGLDELAASILTRGLLQNLVVHELPGKGSLGETYFELQAGNRRFYALHLLVKAEKITIDFPVPCLVNPEDQFDWVNLIENTCRVDVAPWHVGRRLMELMDTGAFTQEQIAARINKSQGYVSRMLQIAGGLHPNVTFELDKLRPDTLTIAEIKRMSKLVDKHCYPDEKLQTAYLKKLLENNYEGRPRKKQKKVGHKQMVYRRFVRLRDELIMRIPGEHYEATKAIVEYVNGDSKVFSLK